MAQDHFFDPEILSLENRTETMIPKILDHKEEPKYPFLAKCKHVHECRTKYLLNICKDLRAFHTLQSKKCGVSGKLVLDFTHGQVRLKTNGYHTPLS